MDSASLCTGEIRLEQHFRATGNVRNDRVGVSVKEYVDKIDPPIHTESEQPP